MRRFAWAAAALGIVCTLIIAASPWGRAHMLATLQRGGTFGSATVAPVDAASNQPSVTVPASKPGTIRMIGGVTYEEVERIPAAPDDAGLTYTWTEEALPLAEANARLPVPLKPPTWAPSEFSGSNWVIMIAPDGAFSHLRVRVEWSVWEQFQYGGWPIYLFAMYPTTPNFEPKWTGGQCS
jgi:hypothetical protein